MTAQCPSLFDRPALTRMMPDPAAAPRSRSAAAINQPAPRAPLPAMWDEDDDEEDDDDDLFGDDEDDLELDDDEEELLDDEEEEEVEGDEEEAEELEEPETP